jgi:hypothetical protein
MAKSEVKLIHKTGAVKLTEMSENPAVYTEFLKFQGRIFKQSATVALEFFAQKPDVQFIASAKQWSAAGYRIKDGGEAIHFTDESGNQSDLFDFSQIEGDIAPRLWSINAENAEEFKTALGAEKDAPIIKSVMEQTVKKSSVIECMEALEIPPQEFETFAKSYFNAVQTIIAGRFEIGGNKFDITPNMTAFNALDDARKMHFLTMVANTAKTALLKVEKVANEIATKNIQNQERGELNEKTNLSTVGSSDTGGAEQHTGEDVRGNSSVGENESVLHGRSDDEGESVDSAHSGIAKLNSVLGEDETSAISEKEVGVFSMPQSKGRSRKKADPNQLSLWDIDEPTETPELTQQEAVQSSEAIAIPTDAQIVTDELMRGSHFQNGKFRIEDFAKAEFAKEKPDMNEFAKFLKDEYGTGGHSGDEVIKAVDYDSHDEQRFHQ